VILPVLACLLVLGVAAAPARAAGVAYGETGSFGGEGVGVKEFKRPTGVAVDQSSGDVYVVDAGNARVQKLGPKGEFILMFGQEINETKVIGGKAAEANVCTQAEIEGSGVKCKAGVKGAGAGQFGVNETCAFGCFLLAGATGVAVDPESHDVYVADSANERVEEFTAAGAYITSVTHSFSAQERFSNELGAGGVAVDPVADKANGGHDLYVTDYANNVVDVFSSAGAYLRQLSVEAPDGVAFDASGNAYVIARAEKTVYKFTNGEGAGVKLSLEGGVGLAEAITVDSAGDLLVAEHGVSSNALKVLDFAPSGTRLTEFGEGSSIENAPDPTGVAVDLATATAYFSGGMSATGALDRVWSFERQVGEPPTAVTASAKEETASTATLTGIVNPEGHASEFWFKYGLTTEGYSLEAPAPHGSAGAGNIATEVTTTISELQPHATYHYRLFAHSVFGMTEASEAKELKTLSEAPLVSGEQDLSITQTEAKVQAPVNPNNEATHWHIEYSSTSPSLSSGVTSVPSPEEEIVAGYGNVYISLSLSPLAPNTVYYWRAVASNTGGGTRQGSIEEFRTAPPPPMAVTSEASKITDFSATIEGTVDPASVGPSSEADYYIEYSTGEAPAPTSSSECSGESGCFEVPVPSQRVGGAEGGESPLPVTAELEGLKPLTAYHYRVFAYNHYFSSFVERKNIAYGADETFMTLPLAPGVVTDMSTAVGGESATLTGVVVSQGAQTIYYFKYGTSSSYASSTPGGEASAADLTASQGVTASIAGLRPQTTYHYVLVATSSGGTVEGAEQTLTTGPALPGSPETLPAGFSLAGTPVGAPAAAAFSSMTGLTPTPAPKATTKPKPKALTNAQKLSQALKACRKQVKKKRAGCKAKARKIYGSTHKAKKSDRRSH
jgi:DNA-binding beta-propeller fold protein YncE